MKCAPSLALLAALGLAAAAAHAGPFDLPEGTQPHALDAQTPPADVASTCESCHAGGTDEAGKHYRPWDSWAGTMMANAARDPLFLAALTVAEQDAPGVGGFCLRCHSPQAFVRGDTGDGLGGALTDDDRQGVACEGCHRSTDPSVSLGGAPPVDPNGPYAGNARLFWDPGADKHGPYSDADSPAHTTAVDPFTSSSRLCGQCHEVANPAVHLLDGAGNDTGQAFPLDTTYTEWESSSFASGAGKKECIDCHMVKAKGDLTLSTFPTAMTRTDPRMHAFVGGNVWGIDAVKASDPALASARALAFAEARAAAYEILQSAAKVEISGAPPSVDPGQAFTVTVRVTNLAGHRFPTGYADGRRAWLRVELLDAAGGTRQIIGRYDEETKTLEPDAELRIYEAVQEARAGAAPGVPFHVARSNTIAKDTRIPPAGFVPGPSTPIVGADYDDGQGGVRAYDEATFHLTSPADAPAGPLKVRATVMYQSTVKELIAELAAANTTDDRGTKLAQIYGTTGASTPITVTSAEVAVPLSIADAGAGGSGGQPGGAGGSSAGGAAGKAPAESGCGCRAAGSGDTSGLAALAALLLLSRPRSRGSSRRRPSP